MSVVRFTDNNDRVCDYARPDNQAGLHKHVVNHFEITNGLNHCMACGRDWEPRAVAEQATGERREITEVPQPAVSPTQGGRCIMSHEDLRKAAVKWLTGTMKCTVVLSEIASAAFEIPDAVGWKFGNSIAVECKVSRADLRRNSQKTHERAGRGVGAKRYFLCPEQMVDNGDDLLEDDNADWGLLWISEGGRIRVRREALARQSNERQEILMLTSALRRIKTREFLVIIPDVVGGRPEETEAQTSGVVAKEEGVSYPEGAK